MPDPDTVTVVPNPLPALSETSNPAGGVTVMPAPIFAPETLKLVFPDAVPYVVLNAAGVPEAEIVGVFATVVTFIVSELSLVQYVFTARTR